MVPVGTPGVLVQMSNLDALFFLWPISSYIYDTRVCILGSQFDSVFISILDKVHLIFRGRNSSLQNLAFSISLACPRLSNYLMDTKICTARFLWIIRPGNTTLSYMHHHHHQGKGNVTRAKLFWIFDSAICLPCINTNADVPECECKWRERYAGK